MPRAGAVTLTDLRERGMERLVIACDKCGRRGSYQMARAGELWAPDATLPDILASVSADCSDRRRQTFGGRCEAKFGGL